MSICTFPVSSCNTLPGPSQREIGRGGGHLLDKPIKHSYLETTFHHACVPCICQVQLDEIRGDDHQIKNAVRTAYALAMKQGKATFEKPESSIATVEDFNRDFRGAGQVGNMRAHLGGGVRS